LVLYSLGLSTPHGALGTITPARNTSAR